MDGGGAETRFRARVDICLKEGYLSVAEVTAHRFTAVSAAQKNCLNFYFLYSPADIEMGLAI